jgi:hypothetical protein
LCYRSCRIRDISPGPSLGAINWVIIVLLCLAVSNPPISIHDVSLPRKTDVGQTIVESESDAVDLDPLVQEVVAETAFVWPVNVSL